MTLQESIKKALTTSPLVPANVPLVIEQQQGEELYKKGFSLGWQAYKTRIAKDLKNLTTYGGVLELANFEQPLLNEDLHYALGYTAGWNAYRRFLKRTFFG